MNIYDRQPTENSNIYFPNASHLKIKHQIKTLDYPLISILNGIVPMQFLLKIVIKNCELYYDECINIISCTSQLHTFACDYLYFDDGDSYEKENPMFEYVSKK